MSQIQYMNLDQGIKENIKGSQHDKLKKKINFLQQVLCQNQTIKTAATISKIKFATAKVVLKNFRKYGYIKNSDKDYEKQIEMLKQIDSIKSDIKQEKIKKREYEFKMLRQKIIAIQPSIMNKIISSQIDVGSKIKDLEEELKNQKYIQLKLVKSVLLEQMKLMKPD